MLFTEVPANVAFVKQTAVTRLPHAGGGNRKMSEFTKAVLDTYNTKLALVIPVPPGQRASKFAAALRSQVGNAAQNRKLALHGVITEDGSAVQLWCDRCFAK